MEEKKQAPDANRDKNWRTFKHSDSVFEKIGPAARLADETAFQYSERKRKEKRILKGSLKGVYLEVHHKKTPPK